jgi:hypothetical protein
MLAGRANWGGDYAKEALNRGAPTTESGHVRFRFHREDHAVLGAGEYDICFPAYVHWHGRRIVEVFKVRSSIDVK